MDYKTNDTTPASPDDDQLLKNIADYAGGNNGDAAGVVVAAGEDLLSAVNKPSTEHVDFIFGNGGATTMTPHPVVAMNTNGKRRSDQMDLNDDDDAVEENDNENDDDDEVERRPINDFGPETDVDAIDEAISNSSPLSPVKSNNELTIDDNMANIKASDLMNENELESMMKARLDASNPFSVQEIHHDLLADKFSSEYANGMDENKFLETVVEDVNDDDNLHAAHHQAAAIGRIDFSEKKEFSFEREEFEKELDTISDVQAALQVADDAFAAAVVKSNDDDYATTTVDDDEDDDDMHHHQQLLKSSVGDSGVNEQLETIAASNLQELLEVTHAEPIGNSGGDLDSFIVPEPEHGKRSLFFFFNISSAFW